MKFKEIILPPELNGHHYFGWSWIVNRIQNEVLDSCAKISLDSFVDSCFWLTKPNVSERWAGIVHAVAEDPNDLHGQTLANLVRHPWFLANKKKCLGLVTLSKHTAKELRRLTEIPVAHLYHPKECGRFFDINEYFRSPRLSHGGLHSRNVGAFSAFETRIKKELIINRECYKSLVERSLSKRAHDINIKEVALTDEAYISNLTTSIGFCYYDSVAASNSLLEHIVSWTPVVTNKHPAVVEYIGEDYPLFYEDIRAEPDCYLLDRTHIQKTSEYLRQRSQSGMFSIERFRDDLLALNFDKALTNKGLIGSCWGQLQRRWSRLCGLDPNLENI